MMAGRKRKPGVIRQPGGRIDHGSNRARRGREEDMRQIAYDARTARFGVTRTQAAEMPETTFLGFLMAGKAITVRHMDAARRYREIIEDWDRYQLAKGYPHSSPFDKMGGYDGTDGTSEEYRRGYDRAESSWKAVQRCMAKARLVDFRAPEVTERVVLWDYDMRHQVDALIVGLDHLVAGLDIPGKMAHAK
jgi:hypothetical protein